MLDQAGVYCCGAAWPVVAGAVSVLVSTGVLALVAHSLRTLLAPCGWVAWALRSVASCCPCPRRRAPEAARLDRLLPPAPPPPRGVTWCGPTAGADAATGWYRRNVKDGRGTNRGFNDLIIRRDQQVARVKMKLETPERINQGGLWVEYGSVKGASSRGLRQDLEKRERHFIHLCRRNGCAARDGELHCCEYAIVDNEAIVDLGEHARFHVCRVFVIAWRGFGLLWKGALILASAATCCGSCLCRRRRRRRTATGVAAPGVQGAVAYLLDQDSESEVESEEHPC